MLGVAIERTGLQGSQIGNAYKTILSRITKASKSEGTMDEDISAAEKSLKAVGVQVRSSEGDFRDVNDILGDLAGKWSTLNDVQKNNISYNVAGIRQKNILSSLLTNFQEYQKIADSASKAEGTTETNQAKYAASITGHLNELKAMGQSTWTTVINTDVIKAGTSALKGMLSVVQSLTKAFGGFGTAGIAVTLGSFIKNLG